MATASELAVRVAQSKPPVSYDDPPPPPPPWAIPEYGGSDAGYAAWLAQAKLRGSNTQADAKMRKAQSDEAYRQALQDIELQGTNGRRTLQGNMLQRGIFRSGETDRRRTEFDAAIEQGRERSKTAWSNQYGAIDADERNALAGLSMEAAQQVSQAMLRDALAAYQAQQTAAAAPVAAAASATPAPAALPHPTYSPTAPAAPTYNPVTNSAGLYAAQSKPKPKPPSGSTGKLKQTRTGGAQLQ